jgi:hypothetical protein
MSGLATVHEVKHVLHSHCSLSGGQGLGGRGSPYMQGWFMFELVQYFPEWVQLKWKKKVCDKHISRTHADQQTKHTKEH